MTPCGWAIVARAQRIERLNKTRVIV